LISYHTLIVKVLLNLKIPTKRDFISKRLLGQYF